MAWDARQALTWEGSSALVLSLARFSDGTVMDVSGRSSVEALVTAAALPSSPQLLEQTAPAPAQVVPFVLGSDASSQLPLLTINATVRAPAIGTGGWNKCPICISLLHVPLLADSCVQVIFIVPRPTLRQIPLPACLLVCLPSDSGHPRAVGLRRLVQQ